MKKNGIRAAIAAAAISAALTVGAPPAVAAPAAPLPAPPVEPAALSLPLIALVGPLAPLVAGLLCLPTLLVAPLYPVCLA